MNLCGFDGGSVRPALRDFDEEDTARATEVLRAISRDKSERAANAERPACHASVRSPPHASHRPPRL
jgi:hypothetical protein